MRRALIVGVLAVAILVLPSAAPAQAPPLLSVQGALFDLDGAPIDGTVFMQFALYEDVAREIVLHQEAFDVDVTEGFFAVHLGAGDVALDLGVFSRHPTAFLGVAVEDDAEMDLVEIATAPWAAFASRAGEAVVLEGGFGAGDFVLAGDISWEDIADIPAGLEDDADTLGALSCEPGGVPSFDGSDWSCSVDSLASLDCGVGRISARVDGGWTCAGLGPGVTVAYTSNCTLPPIPGIQCPGWNVQLDYEYLDRRYLTAAAADARYIEHGESGSITGAMIALTTIQNGNLADDAVNLRVLDISFTDARYVRQGQEAAITSEMIADGEVAVADLDTCDAGSPCAPTSVDARYVNEGQSNSVTTVMIAQNAVTISKINGTEVGLYRNEAQCEDPGVLTPSSTCQTRACSLLHFDCADPPMCSSPAPLICPNERIGFLVDPNP